MFKVGDRVKVSDASWIHTVVCETFMRGHTYIVCEITEFDGIIVERSGRKFPHPRGGAWHPRIFEQVKISFVLEEVFAGE